MILIYASPVPRDIARLTEQQSDVPVLPVVPSKWHVRAIHHVCDAISHLGSWIGLSV